MKKMLIVDDVPEYLNALSRALSDEYEVVKAVNLEEAKKNTNSSIEIALIDIRLSEQDMANRDGIIFLGWLHENYPDVHAVMMSAYKDYDSAVDALNLGASQYLRKPINLRELRELISALMKKS